MGVDCRADCHAPQGEYAARVDAGLALTPPRPASPAPGPVFLTWGLPLLPPPSRHVKRDLASRCPPAQFSTAQEPLSGAVTVAQLLRDQEQLAGSWSAHHASSFAGASRRASGST